MEYFEFYNPVKLLCGESALENIPYELARLGSKRPLVLISRTMMEDGILEQIGGHYQAIIETDIPKDSSFSVVDELAGRARLDGCDGANPSVETLRRAIALGKERRVDFLLAVGGGSVLDTAKAVRVLLSQNKTMLRDLLGSEWLTRAERVPFLMVPTTSGTGSECTGVAVIQDDKNGWKQEIVSDQFLPDVAVLDPRSTEKLPANLTAACGMDALTHAVEAYSGIQRNPLSNAYAYSAVELIGKNLIAAVREPKNQNYRMAMACASAMAGIAFSNSMVGLVHATAHAIGSVCGVSHGEAAGRWIRQERSMGNCCALSAVRSIMQKLPICNGEKNWWKQSRIPCCTSIKSVGFQPRSNKPE